MRIAHIVQPMDTNRLPMYRQQLAASGYDLLNAVLWAPSGSTGIRRRFVASLELRPGERALELGCGTGLVTQALCSTGAEVTAVDRAPAMLAATRRRAPSATVVAADLESGIPSAAGGAYDVVVLAFVLHELLPTERVEILRLAKQQLRPAGRIAILEWARPDGALLGRAWAAAVKLIEPPEAHDVLDLGLDVAIERAGLVVRSDDRVASGRARIVRTAPRCSAVS